MFSSPSSYQAVSPRTSVDGVSPSRQRSPLEASRVDLRRSANALAQSHDAMVERVDRHVSNRRTIDVKLSDLSNQIRQLEKHFQLKQESLSLAVAESSTTDPKGSLVEPSFVLLARLECDLDMAAREYRMLREVKAERMSLCAQLEDAIRNECSAWYGSNERREMSGLADMYHGCITTEARLRAEENKLIEGITRAEQIEKEREERLNRRREKLRAAQAQLDEQEIVVDRAEAEVERLKLQVEETNREKLEWEQKLQASKRKSAASSPRTKQESEVRELESQKAILTDELRTIEKLTAALRQSEMESLHDPASAMIVREARPTNATDALIWDATRPVRSVMSLRDTILILKAHLLNLYDDLDEISETVDAIRGDPQYSMYAAFSEQSNQWRQQKLYDAFHDAVQLMRNRLYETDASAANALLRQLKYFVVVYDLFENHYDAVVNAIMLSDGKWAEASDMLDASIACQRVISAEMRRPSSIMKRRSASTMSHTSALAQQRAGSVRK